MTQPVSAALARKLSVGQEEQGDKPRSVLRALRLAFARAAGDRLQLPLAVIGARQSHRTPETLTEQIGEDWLLLQLANDAGVTAAVCMDMGAVSAIVQVQTIGEVLAEDPAPRPFTHTDGAMAAPLVEDALGRAVGLVETPADQANLSGFEFVARFADLRTLTLAMAEAAYRVFDLTIELGGGLRQGQISVFLPDRADDVEGEAVHEEAGPNLEQASGVLRAELNAVICRMSLPLATLSHLNAGDVLPLTGARLDKAEVLTIDRSRAAIGRLGQCGGMRAVRLNEYTTPATVTQSEALEFTEARSTALSRLDPDLAATTEITQTQIPFDPSADSTGDDLNFEDSEQMVAEISQLAGLSLSDTNPDDR